jgi:O-antigen/teichoic acid export membrane protein
VATLLNGAILFLVQHRSLRPELCFVAWRPAIRLLRTGGLYLILQLAGTVTFAADNLIVSHLFKPEVVPKLAVPARLFSVVPLILMMALNPIWPAYSEAGARGDMAWIRRTLRRSLKWTCVTGVVLSVALVVFGRQILNYWVGSDFSASLVFLFGLGVWAVMMSCGNVVSLWLNAACIVRFQAVIACFLAVVSLGLKILLGSRWGVTGVVWATILAYFFCVVVPYFIFIPKFLRTRYGGRIST